MSGAYFPAGGRADCGLCENIAAVLRASDSDHAVFVARITDEVV